MPCWSPSCAWSSAIRAATFHPSVLPSSPARPTLPLSVRSCPSIPQPISPSSRRPGALHTTIRSWQFLCPAWQPPLADSTPANNLNFVPRSFVISDALQYGSDDQRQRDRSIVENFRELPALFRRHKFPPGNRFRVSTAAQPSPMHRFRANPHTIVVALQRKFLVPAPREQLRVDAELLRPVARHSSTNCQNSHALRRQHGIGKFFKVFEGIEPQQRTLIPQAGNLVQRKIDSQLRIAECRNKNRNVVFVGGFQNSPPWCILVQVLADAPVNFPTAPNVLRLPFVEDMIHHFFNVVEIRLWLQRIVNAVIPSLEEFTVAHLGVVAEMLITGGFHQTMRH